MSVPPPVGAAGQQAPVADPQQQPKTHFTIDDQDPIDFIEKEVLQASGRNDLAGADFEIKGKYEKENGKVKAKAFGNPPRICFKKTYTATFKDQQGQDKTLTFEKIIYTSVRFPDKNGGEQDFNNAIRLAAMAASLYGKSIKNTLLQKAGKPIDPAFAGKLAQIQRDGFIRLAFLSAGRRIDDPLKAMRKNQITFDQITDVELKFSPNATKNTPQHIAPLAIKVNHVFKKNQKGLLERIAAKEFTIEADFSTPPYIHDMAQARKVRDILEDDSNTSLEDQLINHNISKSTYFKQLQTDFEAKREEFEQRQAFFRDLKELDQLRSRYGKSTDPAISQDTLMLIFSKMPKIPKLEKMKFWKTQSQVPLQKAVAELRADKTLDQSIQNELERIDQYLSKCHDEMVQQRAELNKVWTELLKYEDSCSNKVKNKISDQYNAYGAFLDEVQVLKQEITY